MVLAHFSKQIQGLFKDFQGPSDGIRGIFKETTLTQNGTFVSTAKQVQSNFDTLKISNSNSMMIMMMMIQK